MSAMQPFGIRRFFLIFLASIFLSLHYASTLYVNSSFLGGFFSSDKVSLLYVLGALGNIIIFTQIPVLLRSFSKRNLFLLFLSVDAVATAGLALASGSMAVAILFVIFSMTLPAIYLLLDFFLEDVSLNENTGEVRGLYLTSINAAIAAGPLIVAAFADKDIQDIYLLALILLIPIFFSFLFFPKSLKPSPSHRLIRQLPIAIWWKNLDIRKTTIVRFVLNFFYALMTIFTPIYLHQVIGFNWEELGLMFTIMLLPFVFFEWPVGEIEDRYLGEKEIMTLGLFIMGLALVAIPFLGKDFVLWASILFLSRIGASFVEISTESYFFKKVSGTDTGLISIFRLANPASMIVGAIFGGLLIHFLPFNILFFFIALVVLLGMFESAFIHDTL